MAEVSQILCPNCKKANKPLARFCQHCGQDIILNNDGTDEHVPRYRITRVIKAGGMGAVYEGTGVGEDTRTYAIKELLDRFTDPKEREEGIQRFHEEALLLQRLNHQRIPKVYNVFRDEGRFYLTMDFVRGHDLEEVLKQRGKLPEEQVLEWADQICDVLQYLHDNGLIYRDMKPSNIMIDESHGGVKLVDFGIAKVFQPSERGTQIGTPGYAPPEQYQGRATPSSDIYALGATLHHLLSGRDPREEAPFSFPPVRDLNLNVSRRTSDAIAKALQMNPEERFATVAEFRAMLRPLAAARPTSTASTTLVQKQTTLLPESAAAQVSGPAMANSARGQAPTSAAKPAPAPRQPTGPVQPAPRQPTGPVQAAPRQPTARTQPQPPLRQPRVQQRRQGGNWFVNLLLTLLLLLGLAVGVYAIPNPLTPYLPALPSEITNLLPQTQPTPVQFTSQRIGLDVEASLPEGSSDADIRVALRDAYQASVRAQYGDLAQVNIGTLAPVGSPECTPDGSGNQLCRARMEAFVSLPR